MLSKESYELTYCSSIVDFFDARVNEMGRVLRTKSICLMILVVGKWVKLGRDGSIRLI